MFNWWSAGTNASWTNESSTTTPVLWLPGTHGNRVWALVRIRLVKTGSGQDKSTPVSKESDQYEGFNFDIISLIPPKFMLQHCKHFHTSYPVCPDTYQPCEGSGSGNYFCCLLHLERWNASYLPWALNWRRGFRIIAPSSDTMPFAVVIITRSPHVNLLTPGIKHIFTHILTCQQSADHAHMANAHKGIFLFMEVTAPHSYSWPPLPWGLPPNAARSSSFQGPHPGYQPHGSSCESLNLTAPWSCSQLPIFLPP